MKALILLTIALVGLDAGAQQRRQGPVIKFETIGASNALPAGAPANFCVKTVADTAIYESIHNDRGLRQYECQVGFTGQPRAGGAAFRGTRVLSYRAVTVVVERRQLRRQEEYFRSLEDDENMMGFVAIPDSVYRALPSVSRDREERRIEAATHALIPTDGSFQAATRSACYVALLETLDNACSPADLTLVRADIERRLEALNPQRRATEYAN